MHRIAGYSLSRRIGAGGTATVFAATDANGAACAVKILHVDVEDEEEMRQRFFREVGTESRLLHPNILELLDYGVTEAGAPFLVLPLLTGVDLRGRMEAGAVGRTDTLRILLACADALAYAHGLGIVHRDLKPENVFLEGGGLEFTNVRVLDYGHARSTRDHRLTRTGAALGTPQYMGPERFLASETLEPASDVYALGVVAFELLMGERPFGEGSLAELIGAHLHAAPPSLSSAGLAPELGDLLERTLHKTPAHRPLALDLARVLAQQLGA